MKKGILSAVFLAFALAAATAANAGVSVVINPFGFVAVPPPVIYRPRPYYAAPPVVYEGRGSWGHHRGGHAQRHVGGGRRR